MKSTYFNTLILFVGCLILSSCYSSGKNISTTDVSAINKGYKMIEKETLMTLTIQEANEHYGTPIENDRFSAAQGLLEFRVELYNVAEKDQLTDVFEATWSYSDKTNITVWYTEQEYTWKPIHSLEWEKGTEF